MFAKVEAVQASLENVTYQMNHMTYAEQSERLAGHIGLLKMVCSSYFPSSYIDKK